MVAGVFCVATPANSMNCNSLQAILKTDPLTITWPDILKLNATFRAKVSLIATGDITKDFPPIVDEIIALGNMRVDDQMQVRSDVGQFLGNYSVVARALLYPHAQISAFKNDLEYLEANDRQSMEDRAGLMLIDDVYLLKGAFTSLDNISALLKKYEHRLKNIDRTYEQKRLYGIELSKYRQIDLRDIIASAKTDEIGRVFTLLVKFRLSGVSREEFLEAVNPTHKKLLSEYLDTVYFDESR